MLTDDEQEYYRQKGRDACTCPDDQRWYAAALNYVTKLPPPVNVCIIFVFMRKILAELSKNVYFFFCVTCLKTLVG